jgi:hypothetical protein
MVPLCIFPLAEREWWWWWGVFFFFLLTQTQTQTKNKTHTCGMNAGFEVVNERNGKRCFIAIDARTDELQVMPFLRTTLMMTGARVAKQLRHSRVRVRKGYRGTKMARRVHVMEVLRKLGGDPSMSGVTAKFAKTAETYLRGMHSHRGWPCLQLGGDPQGPSASAKGPLVDVILHDRLWEEKFGAACMFAPCEGDSCRSSINPLCHRTTPDRLRQLCPSCAKKTPCLRNSRRTRRRALVWLHHFGPIAQGPCAAGCPEVLQFVRPWQQGHVQSSADGGKAELRNLRPVCGSCNLRQGTEHMEAFARREHGTLPNRKRGGASGTLHAEMLYDCMLRGHDPRPSVDHLIRT